MLQAPHYCRWRNKWRWKTQHSLKGADSLHSRASEKLNFGSGWKWKLSHWNFYTHTSLKHCRTCIVGCRHFLKTLHSGWNIDGKNTHFSCWHLGMLNRIGRVNSFWVQVDYGSWSLGCWDWMKYSNVDWERDLIVGICVGCLYVWYGRLWKIEMIDSLRGSRLIERLIFEVGLFI